MSKIKRKKLLNPLFATDSYKHSHHGFVPDGTSLLYSHLTPRGNKRFLNNYPNHDGKIVVYGIRYLIEELKYRWKKGFFDRKWKKIEKESLQVLGHHLGFTETDLVKFKKLHELGYLPLQIKAIKEGSIVDVGVPIVTVVNTLPEYFWLTNFIESYILNTLCPAMTAATITREFAKLRDQYFDMTVEDQTYKGFHLHNFSYRGCHGHEVAGLIGSAHNLFTLGTDTLYGIAIAQEYYGAGEVAYSVNACFDKETEILTSTGYKKFENLNPTDLVAQFTKDCKIEFVSFTNYIKQQYKGKMINFFNKNQNVDLLVTPNHKMVRHYKRHNKDEYQLIEASTPNIYKHPGCYLPLSGVCEQVGIEFTSLDQLKIAFQADGSFASHADDYTGTRSNTKPIRFHLKKQRKIDRLESILNTLGFKYTKSDLMPDGYVNFWISLPLEVFTTFSKTFNWVNISNVNANWASSFINELTHWDGHEPRENLITYSSICKTNTDIIQALAVLCNMSTKYNCIIDSRTDFNRQDLHSLIIHKTRNTLNTNTFVQVEEDYDDYVYCVSVPSKMIVVRRNNKVAVCGNCEHSVVTLGINYYDNEDKLNGEYLNLRSLLTEKYPNGILSYIADSYDFWRVIDTILPNLKEEIMTREGKLVIRPDCYSSDTQVLTPYGFKLFSQLQEDDLVAQVLDNGTYEFVKPLKIVNEPYKGKMYHFKDQHGKVDQVVTPNHRMIYKQINPTNNLIITEKVKFAEDMKTSGNYLNYFERSAKAQNQNKSLTLLERLNIAFQADGSYVTNSNNSIRFSFSKQRKIDRLSSLLTEANIPFKTYQLASGNTEFNISLDKNLVSKDFNWINVSNLCSNWCEEFLEELKHWDSSVRSSSRFKYDTTNKTCSDIVELIALSAGKGVLTTESEDNREAHFSNIFTSNILDSNRCGGQSWIKEEIDYDGTVHCVQIPTGRLIVKRNRSIMVCGNSGEPIYNLCGYRVIETPEVYSIEKAIEYAALNNAEVVKTDGRFYLIEPQINTPTTHKEISEAEALGLVETLWNTFGGTTNTKGYRQLDSHIGIIYGDGLSYHKVKLIYQLLSAKGFAVDNVILAQGAYTMSTLNDRDQFNVAIKASAAIVNGDIVPVFKDPATDHGKKSVKGFLKVTKDEQGKFTVHEDVTEEEELTGELEVVLYDGTIYNSNVTYEQIKEIVNS